jgi:hypothetical protein
MVSRSWTVQDRLEACPTGDHVAWPQFAAASLRLRPGKLGEKVIAAARRLVEDLIESTEPFARELN